MKCGKLVEQINEGYTLVLIEMGQEEHGRKTPELQHRPCGWGRRRTEAKHQYGCHILALKQCGFSLCLSSYMHICMRTYAQTTTSSNSDNATYPLLLCSTVWILACKFLIQCPSPFSSGHFRESFSGPLQLALWFNLCCLTRLFDAVKAHSLVLTFRLDLD